MLECLQTFNVGPAPTMEVEFAPRVNLITGDNGLGKSFLLDLAWWAVTRRWPADVNQRMTSGLEARPRNPHEQASIQVRVSGPASGSQAYQGSLTSGAPYATVRTLASRR